MPTVVVADDNSLLQTGLVQFLSNRKEFAVVSCTTPEQLHAALEIHEEATAFVSSELHVDPRDLVRRAQKRDSRIVWITGSETVPDSLLECGIKGVLFWSARDADVLSCLQTVRQGEQWIHPGLLQGRSGSEEPRASRTIYGRLRPGERKIIVMMMQGLKNQEIAEQLRTTRQTVKNYNRVIYDKLGVSSRVELHLFLSDHPSLANALAISVGASP